LDPTQRTLLHQLHQYHRYHQYHLHQCWKMHL
jgi:hypothetical protein